VPGSDDQGGEGVADDERDVGADPQPRGGRGLGQRARWVGSSNRRGGTPMDAGAGRCSTARGGNGDSNDKGGGHGGGRGSMVPGIYSEVVSVSNFELIEN
jgi:hypothetical protein